MPDADIGAHGWIWVAIEATYGTALDPSVSATPGIYVPILSETLVYTEPDRYYSEQIRGETMHSDVKQSYYHVEGDIVMEVDSRYMPYFMFPSRHTTTKTGAATPWTYTSIPAGQGTTYPGSVTAKGLSIGIVRDNVGFLYSGCVVSQYAFTVENGVLRVTLSMLGLNEAPFSSAVPVPTWSAPTLFGADSHAVYVAAAGTAPTFSAFDSTFNGFTETINHNGEPQNRITRARSASYIKYGITEVSYDTELDFTSRAEYDNFVNLTKRAMRFESINPGGVAGTWAAATTGFRITNYNTVYNTYETSLSGMGDLVMATVNGRAIAIAGGSGYKMECISPTNIP